MYQSATELRDPYPWFTRPCLKAFGPLRSELGFSPPIVEQLGQERYVRFEKGTYIVSIMYEPGHEPLIEFFCPTRVLENRRIPRLQVPNVPALDAFNSRFHTLCDGRLYHEADRLLENDGPSLERAMEQYMDSQFQLLLEQERDFLRGSASGVT